MRKGIYLDKLVSSPSYPDREGHLGSYNVNNIILPNISHTGLCSKTFSPNKFPISTPNGDITSQYKNYTRLKALKYEKKLSKYKNKPFSFEISSKYKINNQLSLVNESKEMTINEIEKVWTNSKIILGYSELTDMTSSISNHDQSQMIYNSKQKHIPNYMMSTDSTSVNNSQYNKKNRRIFNNMTLFQSLLESNDNSNDLSDEYDGTTEIIEPLINDDRESDSTLNS